MSEDKLLSINECCELLKVSRPTFNKMRRQYNFKDYLIGSRPRFSKNEITTKVLNNKDHAKDYRVTTSPQVTMEKMEAISLYKINLDKSFSGKNVDISRFILIDAYYASALLCKLIAESAQVRRRIYDSKGLMIPYFQKLNFLTYIQKFSTDLVEIDPAMFASATIVFLK